MSEPSRRSVIEADPDLGQLLPPDRLERARRDLVADVHRVGPGPWEATGRTGPLDLGVLLLDGLMVREIALSDSVSSELLGPGDVIRPWQDQPSRLLQHEQRWIALDPVRLCVLDRRFALAVSQYPEVMAIIVERLVERTQRVATEKAIAQLNGVDRRLLALFWELAERWGRVTPDGITIPLNVSHRVIAQLVGARRPTVSTALSRLAVAGRLCRRPDGTWLLRGQPVGRPVGQATRVVRSRRFTAGSSSSTRPAVNTLATAGDEAA
jgi:CRP/FNR family cyclic AMP-dependent transcriptional regulator